MGYIIFVLSPELFNTFINDSDKRIKRWSANLHSTQTREELLIPLKTGSRFKRMLIHLNIMSSLIKSEKYRVLYLGKKKIGAQVQDRPHQ